MSTQDRRTVREELQAAWQELAYAETQVFGDCLTYSTVEPILQKLTALQAHPPAAPERLSARWQELFWALPSGEMRSKLRALEIDIGRMLREQAPSPAVSVAEPEIECPACGETVKQVASATLSLALWQHYTWTCRATHPESSNG
jgi:hypothetical protein